MDAFGPNELERLTVEQSSPSVSIYLPTHAAGEAGQQDPVRLKNLLDSAEQQLADNGMRPADARKLLGKARELPTDPAFWGERSEGLAIFIAPQRFACYRLPLRFAELALVGGRFHVKPLLPLLSAGDRFYILALSQNNVRLFNASRYAIEQVPVSDLPVNMKAALNYADAARGSQVHSATRGSQGKQSLGKQAAVFHGQGGQPDTRKDDLANYFRAIDAALQPVLRGEKAPLLLAGVDYLLPIYRETNSYSHVAKTELAGNWDHLAPHQLHERTWPLVAPTFQQACAEAADKYARLAGTGKASDDIRQVLPAAHEGRVDTLFVDLQAHCWGRFDPQTRNIELHEGHQTGDDDLLDLAVIQALAGRGTVHAVQRENLPSSEPIAAVFRY